MHAGGAAINVCGLRKEFGGRTAVNGITFSVAPGETLGLLGPNGAGKSTLIRMLTTLLIPTLGTASINGCDVVKRANDVRRAIGVVPQALTSDPELSVRANMLFHARLYGVQRARQMPAVLALIEAVGLQQSLDQQVKHLSGGMRRRVEIARGLLHDPQVLFLDEPTTGLDPVSRAAVWKMLQDMQAARSLTILLTTHYMDEADRLCDRIAIVDQGELVALDTPSRLKESIGRQHATLDDVFAHYTRRDAHAARPAPVESGRS